MRVVVVGGGLGGLSTACHLSRQDHDITVVEREPVPGGRAGLWQIDGYSFDTGPTVLTMTGILSETFAAAGADMADHLTLDPADPMYRAVFADGSEILCRHGIEAMQAEILDKCGRHDADAFPRFCEWLGRLYRLELPNFIDRNFDSPLDLARPPTPMLQLLRLGGLRKLASVVGDFFDDERLRRLFSFQAMYAGLSPFEALAIYGVITYMDSVEGVYFPQGGIHAVSRELATAATKAGVDIRYNTAVSSIRRSPSGPVCGVETTSGEFIAADVVVANPDVPAVYRELLVDIKPPRTTKTGTYSPSCVVWLVGLDRPHVRGAAHHNIHFGTEWKTSFDALLHRGRPMPDPSILVTVPTVSDRSLAPSNKSSLYVLEPVPNLDGNIDWNSEREQIKQRLVDQVNTLGYFADPSNIKVESFVDPLEWQRRGMERGTPFALSHTFLQTGPFRPGNIDRRVPGLVLVGSGTVPGVGVPMVLLSGRLAAERVQNMVASTR